MRGRDKIADPLVQRVFIAKASRDESKMLR